MAKVTPKVSDAETGMRIFQGKSGRMYLVLKERGRTVFHVFTEVQATEAAADCGADISAGNTQTIWNKLWRSESD